MIDKLLKRLDGFANIASGLGVRGEDPTLDVHVTPQAIMSDDELLELWRFNAYSALGVDELAYEATRKGWRVCTTEAAPKGVQATDMALDLDKRWRLRRMVRDAISFGRLYGLAGIMCVVEDGKDPREPLDLEKPLVLLNLVLLDKREMQPHEWQDKLDKQGFGEPLTWRVNPRSVGRTSNIIVHTSRIIRFGGRSVPRDVLHENNGADDSILFPAEDAIKHKSQFDNGRAVIVNDFKVDVVKTANLDGIATSDQHDYLKARFGLLAKTKSLLNMLVLDGSEEYIKSSTTVAGLADLDDRTTSELAAALRIPQTRLMGEAPSGLNTDGDSSQRNWASQVSAWQQLELEPILIDLYNVLFRDANSPTKGKIPKKYYIEFLPLDEPTEAERANVRKTVADTDAVYLDRGVVDPDHVARGRFGEQAWSVDLPAIGSYEDDEPIDAEFDVVPSAPEAAATALNGAQVASMVTVVASVAAGEIGRESAIEIIMLAFNVTRDVATRVVGNPEAVTNPKPQLEAQLDEADTYDVPQDVQDNARRALEVRASKPPSQRGMTAVGLARARDLSNGRPVSYDTVKRIKAYLERHEVDKKGATWEDKGKGWQAYNGWGGDAALRWTRAIVERVEAKT
jgi:phage-related protein (TIGR01555 family)